MIVPFEDIPEIEKLKYQLEEELSRYATYERRDFFAEIAEILMNHVVEDAISQVRLVDNIIYKIHHEVHEKGLYKSLVLSCINNIANRQGEHKAEILQLEKGED